MPTDLLRLRTPAQTVIVGFRAALGGLNDLHRIDSEEEIRRCLIHALADPASLDALRRLWARSQGEPIRIDTMGDRGLIERLLPAVQRGALAMYAVPDASVRQFAGEWDRERPRPRSPARGAGGSGGGNNAAAGKLAIGLAHPQDRIKAALIGAAALLPGLTKDQVGALFGPGIIDRHVQVLHAWGEQQDKGLGLLIDALTAASILSEQPEAVMTAAKELAQGLKATQEARTEQEIAEAARHFARSARWIGIPALALALRRGLDRLYSPAAKKAPPPPEPRAAPPPPPVLPKPALPAVPSPAITPPALPDPMAALPLAQAKALQDAAKDGKPFCAICEAAKALESL